MQVRVLIHNISRKFQTILMFFELTNLLKNFDKLAKILIENFTTNHKDEKKYS